MTTKVWSSTTVKTKRTTVSKASPRRRGGEANGKIGQYPLSRRALGRLGQPVAGGLDALYGYGLPHVPVFLPDQLLIYAQRPNATACASLETWNTRLNRWVNRGAKGIALIDDNQQPAKLRYVFDVADTHARYGDRLPYIWRVEGAHIPPLLAHLAYTYSLPDASSLESMLSQIANQVAEDYLDDACMVSSRK